MRSGSFTAARKSEEPSRNEVGKILDATHCVWQLSRVKIIIEKPAEGYVGYPAGVQGVVVGQGSTFTVLLPAMERV